MSEFKQYEGTAMDILCEITDETLGSLSGFAHAVFKTKTTEETQKAVVIILEMMIGAVKDCGLPDVETYSLEMTDNKN